MNNLILFLSTAATAAEDGTQAGGLLSLITPILSMVLLFVIMYFMLIRPQKKREKEVQNMRSSIEVGDEIVTSGGIVGRVVSIREDNVVIETGNDRSKIRVMRWAIQSNNTIHDDPAV